jgi:hypothetical protein
VPPVDLEWLVELHPPECLATPTLATLLGAAFPADRLDAFDTAHGVDLRTADEVVVASLGQATLGLARVAVDPPRVETAFAARVTEVEGRAVDRGVTRFWGSVSGEREQVAVFGQDAVGLERGALGPAGPLRTAIYFAEGRLRRSLPALRVAPLDAVAARLGAAPLRFFAPGPFAAEWAGAFGGLLGASTALGAAFAADADSLHLRLALTGAWGEEAPKARDRLEAAFHALAVDPMARLTGLDRPLRDPVITATTDALALDVALDPVRMVEGVRAAISAPTAEIIASWPTAARRSLTPNLR